ncbi:MAG: CBS domain-containing protein, partial [Anaerolineales bacterium]|nr:CBS domain-containing protein [Anaerolineales bacterium]
MATVRDIIRKKGGEVFSIPPEATVFDALKMMADNNVGALLVMTGGKVEGILSERDCIRRVDLHGRNSRETKV